MAHIKIPFEGIPNRIMRYSPDSDILPDDDTPIEPRPQYMFQVRTERESLNVLATSLKESLDLFLRKQGHEPISIIRKDRVDYTAK